MNIMQEQHPYKITPDQGWAKMKPILDKAMPEDPNKRRYPAAWWSVSAVVVAAVMSILVFDDKSLASEAPAKSETQSISPVTNYKSSISSDQTVSPVTSPTELETKSIPVTKTQDEGKASQQSSSTLKQKGTSSSSRSATPVPSSPTNSEVKAIPMAMAVEPEFIETVPATTMTSSEESISSAAYETESIEELSTGIVMIYEEKYRDARVLEPLPQGNIAALGQVTSDQILTADAMQSKWKTPFVQPTASVSGLATISGGIGVSGGVGVDINVAKRFSVTTSVGYLSYNPNSFLSDGLKALDSNAEYNTIVNYDPSYIGNETYVDAGNLNNKAGYNAINPLIDKLTQWQVITGVKWKVTPRFFTEAGAQFGFNTQAFSEYPIVTTNLSGNAAPPLRIDNSLEDYDVIRSSTTALYLGIGYRIGQHFDVFTNWTHGLNQYILNDTSQPAAEYGSEERTDYIRGLSLGLRYTL